MTSLLEVGGGSNPTWPISAISRSNSPSILGGIAQQASVSFGTSAHLDRLIKERKRTHNLTVIGSILRPQPGVACSPSWSLVTGFLMPNAKFNNGRIADHLNRQSTILEYQPHLFYKGPQGLSRLGAPSPGRFSAPVNADTIIGRIWAAAGLFATLSALLPPAACRGANESALGSRQPRS